MVCDICTVPGMGTIVSAVNFKKAVLNGFNPYKTGLAHDPMVTSGTHSHVSEEWKNSALNGAASHSDWNICSNCMEVLKSYLDYSTTSTTSAANENSNVTKQRHGCVTAWLTLMIIANSLIAIVYLFASEKITDNLPGDVSPSLVILLGIIGIANVIFASLLFQWKKLGFWGFIVTSIGALIINLSIEANIAQSLFGLVGIAILYGILQIKKDNVSTWANLE